MTTRDIVQGYLSHLEQKRDWPSFLSEELVFTSFTSPVKRVTGRVAFLESTKRFYSMITAVGYRLQPSAARSPCVHQRRRRGVPHTGRQDRIAGHLLRQRAFS